MRTRNGFVSNSSSASYIIKVHNITMEELFDICRSELWYEIDGLKSRLEHHLKTYEDDVDDNGVVRSWCSDKIKQLNDYIQRIDSAGNTNEKIKVYLEYRGIDLKEEGSSVILEAFTSMHNSYDEGMPDLLKEICFLFMFDYPHYKIDFNRED